MGTAFQTKAIANVILHRSFADKIAVSPMKLQKLVYLAHGYHLGAYNEPLIDECFEAWPYGPVAPGLYQEFKNFGNSTITRYASDFDWSTEEEIPVAYPTDDKRVNKVVDFVWKTYKDWDALRLSDLTHANDGPWDTTKKKNTDKKKNIDISDDIIKEHFKKLVKRKS